MESKLPKGWKELSPTIIMSEEFGGYVIRIDAACRPVVKIEDRKVNHYHIRFTTVLGESINTTPSDGNLGSPEWDRVIMQAKQFALDTLDDMHTKITQAMDRFEEVLGNPEMLEEQS